MDVVGKRGLTPRIGMIRWRLVSSVLAILAGASWVQAAAYRTQNFLVDAPTPSLAQAVGDAAELYRQELANHWLGRSLPPWQTPCPIRVVAGPHLAAQGVTEYNRQPVRDFRMEVVGTPERILDSVLPHEVTHTIMATHFGRPLPRWADEGICTTVEHEEEKAKHEIKLREFLASRRGIAMNRLFLLTEYPADVLPMYAQGYSVCRFLIEQNGSRAFIDFLTDYMQHPSWTENIRKHYGYESLAGFQEHWLDWVAGGSVDAARFASDSRRTAAAGGLTRLASVEDDVRPDVIGAAWTTVQPQDAPETAVAEPIDAPEIGAGEGPAIVTAIAAIERMAPPSVRGNPGYASQPGLPQRPKRLNPTIPGPSARIAAGEPASVRSSYQAATPQAEGGVGQFGANRR